MWAGVAAPLTRVAAAFLIRQVMVDGGKFDGAKAYKDAKALNMMTVLELHRRLHDSSGVTFNSMYPGCVEKPVEACRSL